jgi:hypothetical protein
MLDRINALGWNELRELIGQSYTMVAAKAPKNEAQKKQAAKKRKIPKRGTAKKTKSD